MFSREFLLELFDYDRERGVLIWKHPSKFQSRVKGKIAGNIFLDHNVEYSRISINDKTYLTHHLIWFLETGNWPKLIDHIDGKGLNNRFGNLRESTTRKNGQNHKRHRNGKLVGAQWRKRQGFWTSQITVQGKRIHLGCFTTEQSAHERYLAELKARGL